MRSVAVLALAAAYLLGCTAGAWADCKLRGGEHVVLYGSADDPSVLAWDSAERLREYNAASFDEARALELHAIDLSPGTRAQVVSCRPDFVQSQTADVVGDAVGVLILTGSYRGLTRWVLSTDIRDVDRAKKQHH